MRATKKISRPAGKRLALVVTMLMMALLLGACGSSSKSSSASTASSGSTITIHNFTFNPPTLTVKAGTTVTVKNTDDTAHTVTALDGSFNTGPIPGGKSATFSVPKVGTFKFHCNIHNYMTGTVQVTS
jgi:plastocyanin